jgi:hypothetical protein
VYSSTLVVFLAGMFGNFTCESKAAGLKLMACASNGDDDCSYSNTEVDKFRRCTDGRTNLVSYDLDPPIWSVLDALLMRGQ